MRIDDDLGYMTKDMNVTAKTNESNLATSEGRQASCAKSLLSEHTRGARPYTPLEANSLVAKKNVIIYIWPARWATTPAQLDCQRPQDESLQGTGGTVRNQGDVRFPSYRPCPGLRWKTSACLISF